MDESGVGSRSQWRESRQRWLLLTIRRDHPGYLITSVVGCGKTKRLTRFNDGSDRYDDCLDAGRLIYQFIKN